MKTIKKTAAWMLVLCMLTALFTAAIPYETATVKAEETAEDSGFVHPGILHTQASIDAMKKNIAKEDPTTLTAYHALMGDGFSNPGWGGRPLEHVVRGGTGDNRAQMYIDIERAYHTALLWKLGAGDQYGDAAVRILNGWAHTMKSLSGNADRFLAAGIYGYQMANAAELVRDHKDFDKEAMDRLLTNVFYPMNHDFLTNHNNASNTNYWANWDLCNIASVLAIGVFCDREDIYQEGIAYYKNGIGMGSILNTMPYVYDVGLAQWQESGRDQGHATLGIGLCGAINEIAWSQGDNLYGMYDNRFLKAAEYVVKYNNISAEGADDVPFSDYTRHNSANGHYETGYGVSGAGRPSVRAVYTAVYNHYVNRMGLEAPEMKKFLYPEDGSVYIEGGQRNGDEPGWQSLTFHNVGTAEEAKEAEEINGPLEDGIYRFYNNKSQKSLVDRSGVLQCAKKGTMDTEWWEIKNHGDGSYTIKNAATGKVLQLNGSEYTSKAAVYTTGTTYVLSEKENGEMNQKFAFLKKSDDYVYRIASVVSSYVMELANANTADDATICQWRYEDGIHQEWLAEKKDTKKEIAYFNFDDETEGLKGAGAIAKPQGNISIAEDSERGKVLHLSGQAWLNAEKEDGSPLLSEQEELTVSFYSKAENPEANWPFYAAANDSAQTEGAEQYLGIVQNSSEVKAERRNGGKEESASGTAEDGWNHMVVVYGTEETSLYRNGILLQTVKNKEPLSEILGDQSIMQIGKANLVKDEFFEGYLDEFVVYNYAVSQEQIQSMEQKKMLADFTFDDLVEGFSSDAAKAVGTGTVDLSEDAHAGKSLYLDGSGSNYLNVVNRQGEPLLTGMEEVSISYWSKVSNNRSNWMFYAAPNEDVQIYQQENYIGAMENNGTVTVERYRNTNRRISSISEEAAGNIWKHVLVTLGKDCTKVYVNGEKKAELKNHYSLPDILGEKSVFYIGKANWSKQSEYCNAWIDDVHIYNYVLSDAQAQKDYAGYRTAILEDDGIDDTEDKKTAQVVVEKINVIGTVEYTDDCHKKITDARNAFEALTDAQKLWVTNMDTLLRAEKAYQALAPYEKKLLAKFTFDDTENGFVSGDARAVSDSAVKLSDRAVSGKALRLDGENSKSFLTLLGKDGKSLVNGCREVTVSYWGKVYVSGANWGFYAAGNDEAQRFNREKYLGIYDGGELTNVVRCYNVGERGQDVSAETERGEWKYLTAVYGENTTKLYINGIQVSELAGADTISEILDGDGVCYVGRANWGDGEYYNGLMDEMSIYNYALSDDEITALYQEYQIPDETLQNRLLAKFTFDEEETGFSGADGKAAAAGSNVLMDDAVSGKSLYLDGTDANYLTVTDTDGNALLRECEEATVSYWSKVSDFGTNWAFYAAKDDSVQEYSQERYLAVAEQAAAVEVQRWKNSGTREETLSAAALQEQWRHITVVYGKQSTRLYINGRLKKEQSSNVPLTDILGDDGVIYLGKANWQSGEYYKGLLDEVSIYNYALTQEEITSLYDADKPEDSVGRCLLAKFTFDDETSGFSTEDAQAAAEGTMELSEDAIHKKALRLNGTASSHLTVTDRNNASLLSGCREISVSYWSKVDNTDANWAMYAAPNDNQQELMKECYLGILDKGDSLLAERYRNSGERPETASAQTEKAAWKHTTVVFGEDFTKIYINGKLQGEKDSFHAIDNILGTESVCYIGRANWGTGEYFNGLLDEFSIYSYALTEEEITELYEKEKDASLEEAKELLKQQLEEAVEKQEADYTEDSWQVFWTALAAANNTAEDANADQSTIRAAALNLKQAQSALKIAGEEEAEREAKELAESKEAANEVIREAGEKKESDYTASSWKVMQDALTALQQIMEAEDATAAKVTEAVEELKKAQSALQPYEQQPDTENPDPGTSNPTDPNPDTSNPTDPTPDASNPTDLNPDLQNPSGQQGSGSVAGDLGAAEEELKKQQAQTGTVSIQEAQQLITGSNTDKGDVKGSSFALLKVKAKEGNKCIKLSWNKVSGADGYLIYGSACGKKMQLVKEVSSSKKSYKVSGLSKGKYYKYIVTAYKNIYGEKRSIGTSVSVHISTKGGNYGNPSGITYKKSKISVKKGKTFTLKPTLKYKKRVKTHIAKVRYESSNPKTASVTKSGKVKGRRKGSCYVYMYTQNGLYKRVKITVK